MHWVSYPCSLLFPVFARHTTSAHFPPPPKKSTHSRAYQILFMALKMALERIVQTKATASNTQASELANAFFESRYLKQG